MSIRKKRNQVFDKITPNRLKPVYHEHGREIANAISFTREVMAPYLFFTAALGIKGRIPGASRLLKALSDGYDGYVAECDKEFKTAEPTVKSLQEFNKFLVDILRDRDQKPKDKAKSFWTLLGATDGAIFDQETDKKAQVYDQFGNLINNDVPTYYFGGTVVRNAVYGRFRSMYADLGVSGSGKASELGQAKTVIYDSQQTLESYGVLDHIKPVRHVLTWGGTALNSLSAFMGITELERAYLDLDGYDTSKTSRIDLASLATARLLTHNMPYIHIEPSEIPRFLAGDSL